MVHDFCEKFLKRLREFQAEGSDLLSAGKARNYEEYQYICGKLRGLEMSENIITNLISEMFESEKIAEEQIENSGRTDDISW